MNGPVVIVYKRASLMRSNHQCSPLLLKHSVVIILMHDISTIFLQNTQIRTQKGTIAYTPYLDINFYAQNPIFTQNMKQRGGPFEKVKNKSSEWSQDGRRKLWWKFQLSSSMETQKVSRSPNPKTSGTHPFMVAYSTHSIKQTVLLCLLF